MKRRKILLVIPALGLLLSGCTFQEGFATAKHWVGQNIYHPLKDWIKGLIGGGGEDTPTPTPEPTPTPTPGPGLITPVAITEVRAPETIEQDAELDPSRVSLTVKYSDDSTQVHAATSITLDTSTVGEDVEGTAYYNDLSKKFTIDVVAKSETNYGDEDHPLTTTQALAIIQKECTADKSFTKQRIFVEGEISEVKTKDFAYDSGPCSELTITDGTTPVHVYRVHMSAELNAHILVGSTIKLNGFGKLNGEDYQFADNSKEQCVATSVVEKTGEDPVESVAFDSATYEVQVGKTQVVHATVLPATAVNKDVVYTLENVSPEGCVTIEGDVITGVAVGTATIKATTVSGAKTNTATVNVVPGLNYGTLENPLTIAEAKALLDKENPAKEPMYITGRINSNKAYNTQYNNTEIWLGESSDEFELYGCNLPDNFAPAQPVENDPALVGKVVVATGTGKIYTKTSTYEFDKGCQIVKFADEPVKEIKSFGEVTGLPTQVYVDGSIDVSKVNIAVTYTDDTPGTVHPTDIQFDNSKAAENVVLHVMYGNEEVGAGLYTVNVVEQPSPTDPIIAEGSYNITATEDNVTYYLKSNGSSTPTAVTNPTEATVFDFELVEGKLDEYYVKCGDDYLLTTDTNNGVKVGDPTKVENSKYVWKMAPGTREGGGYDMSVSISESKNRYLSLYNKQDFRTYDSPTGTNRKVNTDVAAPIELTLKSIAVTTLPTKTEYYAGELLDPTGLVVTGTFGVENQDDVLAPVTGYTLSHSEAFSESEKGTNVTITVTYEGKEATFQVSVSSEDKPVETKWDFTFSKKEWSAQGEITLQNHKWTMAGTRSAGDSDSFNYDSSTYDKGQQFGSASKPFSLVTLTCSDFTNAISSIEVVTAGASGIDATVEVSVGGTAFGTATAISMEKAKYTFAGASPTTGEIVIKWTNSSAKALYIKQIIVNF